jgi:hypothetical protein
MSKVIPFPLKRGTAAQKPDAASGRASSEPSIPPAVQLFINPRYLEITEKREAILKVRELSYLKIDDHLSNAERRKLGPDFPLYTLLTAAINIHTKMNDREGSFKKLHEEEFERILRVLDTTFSEYTRQRAMAVTSLPSWEESSQGPQKPLGLQHRAFIEQRDTLAKEFGIDPASLDEPLSPEKRLSLGDRSRPYELLIAAIDMGNRYFDAEISGDIESRVKYWALFQRLTGMIRAEYTTLVAAS